MEPLFLVREMFPFGQEVKIDGDVLRKMLEIFSDGYHMWVANAIADYF